MVPSSFLPIEDQGYVIVDAQTPPESASMDALTVACIRSLSSGRMAATRSS